MIVCVRKDGFSSWKHGFVANLHDMPPISTVRMSLRTAVTSDPPNSQCFFFVDRVVANMPTQ